MTAINKIITEEEIYDGYSGKSKIIQKEPDNQYIFRPKEACVDFKYLELQSQMMDNGWKLHQEVDDNSNTIEYFTHPTYRDMKTQVYEYKCHPYHNSRILKFPLIDRVKDPKGLGCSIETVCAGTRINIIDNEWSAFWNSRRGRRAAKYAKKRTLHKKKKSNMKTVNGDNP